LYIYVYLHIFVGSHTTGMADVHLAWTYTFGQLFVWLPTFRVADIYTVLHICLKMCVCTYVYMDVNAPAELAVRALNPVR
jgi:hypothetical protein